MEEVGIVLIKFWPIIIAMIGGLIALVQLKSSHSSHRMEVQQMIEGVNAEIKRIWAVRHEDLLSTKEARANTDRLIQEMRTEIRSDMAQVRQDVQQISTGLAKISRND